MTSKPEFIELLVDALDGPLDKDSFLQLEQLMENNPEYIRDYVEFFSIAGMIRQGGSIISISDHQGPNNTPSPLPSVIEYDIQRQALSTPDKNMECQSTAPHRKKPSYRPLFNAAMAASAVILYFLSLDLFLNFSRNNNIIEKTPVATLSKSIDAQWAPGTPAPKINNALIAGRYTLINGYANITSTNGSEIIIQAPADLVLESDKQIMLSSGTVVTRVSEGLDGFTVRTPTASVIDLSTEFGVYVDNLGETVTHVFDGEVEVRNSSNPDSFIETLRLTQGQSAEVGLRKNIISRNINNTIFHRQIPTEYEASIFNLSPSAFYRFEDTNPDFLSNSVNSLSVKGNYQGKAIFTAGSGLTGTAMQFDGNNSICIPGFVPDYLANSNCTIVVILKPQSNNNQCIFAVSDKQGPQTNYSFNLRINQNSQYEFYTLTKAHVGGTQNGKFTLSSNTDAQLGKWTFIAITVNNDNTVNMFINDKLSGTIELNDKLLDEYTDLYIGDAAGEVYNPTNKMQSFKGVIDNIAVFGRALDEKEIKQIYNKINITTIE